VQEEEKRVEEVEGGEGVEEGGDSDDVLIFTMSVS
jgi:hypothetical protein